MEFARTLELTKRKKADFLVLPYWKEAKKSVPAADYAKIESHLKPILKTGDFSGKEGETFIIYPEGLLETRVLLLGLGERKGITVERLRRAFAAATKFGMQKKLHAVNIVIPKIDTLSEDELVQGLVEGLLLPNYLFSQNRSESGQESGPTTLQSIGLIGISKAGLEKAEEVLTICEGVYFARDLVNGNADDVTPQFLAKVAKGVEKTLPGVHTTVFDKKRIEKEGMGLLLAVNRGSSLDPVMIISSYRGDPKSKEHTVLVGKGVTYDTGGLHLKPYGSMETMRGDMAGGAVVLAALKVAAELKLKVNLTVVVPSTENCIDARSFKPGDIYQSYSGKTVEIGNTDAEGRLILADALAYACDHLKPTRIIDIATLTGAMEIALGPEGIGLMSTDDALSEKILAAGDKTFERVVRFPLFEEYLENLKSDLADLKNIGGRPGGAIIAGVFLKSFVQNIPWAHLDIAPIEYFSEVRRYHPKCGTGIGVRLMVEFLQSISIR